MNKGSLPKYNFEKWFITFLCFYLHISPWAEVDGKIDERLAEVREVAIEVQAQFDSTGTGKLKLAPISMMTNAVPRLAIQQEKEVVTIQFSTGMIELVENISMAIAMDNRKKGFLKEYLKNVVQNPNDRHGFSPSRSDDEDLLNEQKGLFAALIGNVISFHVAQANLGYVEKYRSQLTAGGTNSACINNLVTDQEWGSVVVSGLKETLACGYMLEGYMALFAGLEKLPQKPQWLGYFAPEKADLNKQRKEIKRFQENFFNGKAIILRRTI